MKFDFHSKGQPAPVEADFKIKFGIFHLLLLLMMVGLSAWLKWPTFFYPNIIRGELMEMSPNPDGTLWILTNGTFKYTYMENELSYETKGLFCKTYLYHYDPVRRRVLKRVTTRYPSLPFNCALILEQGRLWQINRVMIKPWIINAYDPKNGTQLWNIDTFSARFSEPRPGIAKIYFQDEPARIEIETKDARQFVYLLGADRLLANEREALKEQIFADYQKNGLTERFAFVTESGINSSRQLLYRIHGPAAALVDKFIWPFTKTDGISLGPPLEPEFTLTRLTPDVVYLEPILLYQDQELVVFLHQDQVGDDARRFLTCVTATGVQKWTVPPEKLFRKVMLNHDDNDTSKSGIQFFRSIAVKHQGNLLVLAVQKAGLIGFDLQTGRKLWELKTR